MRRVEALCSGRYAAFGEVIEGDNREIHGSLWDMECPAEVFQRKLPRESSLCHHERLVVKSAEA